MTKVHVRSGYPFNYDQEAASDESGLHCLDDSRTLQSQAKDADINELVKRFGVTGTFPVPERLPSSGDFSQVVDFRTAMDAVRQAQADFLKIPAQIRARFDHDPQAFADFCVDPANQDELLRLGLAVRRPDPDAVLEQEVDREAKKEAIRDKKYAKPPAGGAAKS